MNSFSKRYGHVKVEEIIQTKSISPDSRVMIWNDLYNWLWDNQFIDADRIARAARVEFLKQSADTFCNYRRPTVGGLNLFELMKGSILKLEWHTVYDFIEYLLFKLNDSGEEHTATLLSSALNETFKKEGMAYSIIDGLITPVVGEEEVDSIQNALNNSHDYVRKHFETALGLLSDKTQPDYRNSIKESISAIESLCKKITGNEKGTLGECLVEIEKRGYIHKAMKGAFSQLYGYTSDEGGIRHAFKGEAQEPTLEDARFMLVSCSAFSNYLLAKMAKL